VVRKSFVSITRALSIAYLFAISLTILLQPIAATADGQDRIALMMLLYHPVILLSYPSFLW
jgi:hypothetical protein